MRKTVIFLFRRGGRDPDSVGMCGKTFNTSCLPHTDLTTLLSSTRAKLSNLPRNILQPRKQLLQPLLLQNLLPSFSSCNYSIVTFCFKTTYNFMAIYCSNYCSNINHRIY